MKVRSGIGGGNVGKKLFVGGLRIKAEIGCIRYWPLESRTIGDNSQIPKFHNNDRYSILVYRHYLGNKLGVTITPCEDVRESDTPLRKFLIG